MHLPCRLHNHNMFTNIRYDAENPAARLFLGSSCIHSLRFLFRCIKPKVSFPDCSSHKKFLPQKNRLPYSFGIFLSVGKLLHLDHIQLFKPVNINCHTKIQWLDKMEASNIWRLGNSQILRISILRRTLIERQHCYFLSLCVLLVN